MSDAPRRPGDRAPDLPEVVERQARRLERAERERRGVLAYTTLLGTLGLVFVAPLIAGAYLGRWLDARVAGYSVRWTLSFIVLGLFVGFMNVYLLLRDTDDGQR